MAPDQHRFVFVGGLPRSGTTFVALAVARHSAVSDLEPTGKKAQEGQFLQDVYPSQKDAGGIDRFAYSADMHLTETSPLVTDESRRALWDAWSPYWDTDRPVLMEKTPANLLKMRFLQALYPDSWFIVVVRHPVAQAMALHRHGWTTRPVSKLVDHWVTAHDTMSDDLPDLRRVIVVRYEDIVASPHEALAGIQAFLDLPDEPTELDLDQGVNQAYLDEWRHTGRLAPLANRLTTGRFEARIRRWGYSFESPLPVGPLPDGIPTLGGLGGADDPPPARAD
jgi:sulfotransferase family protein